MNDKLYVFLLYNLGKALSLKTFTNFFKRLALKIHKSWGGGWKKEERTEKWAPEKMQID